MILRSVCTFKFTRYGESGNELPPPPRTSLTISVLSREGESAHEFNNRMYVEGNAMRRRLEEKFKLTPRPYSRADTVDWQVNAVHINIEDLHKVIKGEYL